MALYLPPSTCTFCGKTANFSSVHKRYEFSICYGTKTMSYIHLLSPEEFQIKFEEYKSGHAETKKEGIIKITPYFELLFMFYDFLKEQGLAKIGEMADYEKCVNNPQNYKKAV